MNKVLVLIMCFLAPILSIAQKSQEVPSYITIKDGKVVVSEVVKVDGKSKDAIYKDALLWINNAFNNPKTVIQTKDSDLGLITMKSQAIISNDYYGRPSQWYTFNLSIQAKDGRYKYEFSDIIFNWDMSDIGEFIKNPPYGVNDPDLQTVFGPITTNLKSQLSKGEEEW